MAMFNKEKSKIPASQKPMVRAFAKPGQQGGGE